MTSSVIDRVKQVMALTFNVPADEIADDASQAQVPGWDSLGHANLVLGIEEEFGVELSDSVMPTLRSVPVIVSHLEGQDAGASNAA